MVATEGGPAERSFSDELEVGAHAGPWIIEHELGRGGMGIVYAVVHATNGKRAALKVLHRAVAGRAFKPERVLLEARAVNAIGHPNVVDIFETGVVDDGRPYVVMERLIGESLTERAARGLSPGVAIAILLRVCEALHAAHAAGVVHRDLKPDNIYLVDHPDNPRLRRVKLLDWGIARMLHHDASATLDGQLVGTPQYLAPEQARGERVSPATDVYSLGVVAYELFLGRLPFEAMTATEMLAQHMLAPVPSPRARWVAIPPALEALLVAMLAKDPRARPPIAEVARRLALARAELTRQERAFDVVAFPDDHLRADAPAHRAQTTASIAPPPRRRWPIAVGVLALAASGALFVLAQTAERTAAATEAAPARPTVVIPEAPPPPRTPVAAPAIANPVLAGCADPGALRDGDRWYVACTGREGGNLYPIYASADLATWTRVGWVFPAGAARPAWADGNYWAPELHRLGDRFAAYFSMRGEGRENAIGVATAAAVAGPYRDRGGPLLTHAGGASDAHVLTDRDGTRYLYFKHEHGGQIWAQRLAADGLRAVGKPERVLAPSARWERGNLEGPWVIRAGAYYYLFYSAARYCDAAYAVGVARATSPFGPFEKRPAPILAGGERWTGPGHVSTTRGPDDRDYLVYHAYQLAEGTPSCAGGVHDNDRRHVRIDRLVFDGDWPRAVAAL